MKRSLVVLLSCCALLLALWLSSTAIGQEALTVQLFRQRLQTFDTMWSVVPAISNNHRREFHYHPARAPYVFRWDGTRGVGTLEDGSGTARWSWWAGQAVRDMSPGMPGRSVNHPTETLGPAVDAAVAELWAEVRAGLPNSTFTYIARRTGPERWDGDGYRVELPFAWARAWELYLALNDGGTPYYIGIRQVSDGQWLYYPTRIDVDWNVPLRDDFDRREGYIPVSQVGGMVFHEDGAVRSLFQFDLDATTTEQPFYLEEALDPGPFTAAAWQAACNGNSEVQRPVHHEFTWDSATVFNGERALDAMNAGCTIGVKVAAPTYFTVTPGASASFAGKLELYDGTGALIQTIPVTSNLTAPPNTGKKRWSPHQHVFPLTGTGELTSLRVVLDGELTHECSVAGPPENQVAIAIDPVPELAWPGCWPDMGVIQ